MTRARTIDQVVEIMDSAQALLDERRDDRRLGTASTGEERPRSVKICSAGVSTTLPG
jgi:hypothetical protein